VLPGFLAASHHTTDLAERSPRFAVTVIRKNPILTTLDDVLPN
jgi:hypothetical protein